MVVNYLQLSTLLINQTTFPIKRSTAVSLATYFLIPFRQVTLIVLDNTHFCVKCTLDILQSSVTTPMFLRTNFTGFVKSPLFLNYHNRLKTHTLKQTNREVRHQIKHELKKKTQNKTKKCNFQYTKRLLVITNYTKICFKTRQMEGMSLNDAMF